MPRSMFFARCRNVLAPRVAPPLALVLLLVSYAGCLSTKVKLRTDSGTDGAAVLVRVFANADSAKAGRADAPGTLVELFRLEKGKEIFLQRSLAGQWGVDGLPPGKYRLRVVAVLDGGGNIRETRSGDRETNFSVKAGQTAEVKIILKKTPTGLIVAASLTVIILVVALAIILREKDFTPPIPDLPRPGDLPRLPLPHPPPIDTIVVAPEIWVGPVGVPVPREHRPPPRVTSVIPVPGSVVSTRRVRPAVTFSQPLEESRVRPDTILMLGSQSGLLPGTTVTDQGLLRFEPARDLIPGEFVTVTVRAADVVNPDRRRLEKDFSWHFQVAE